MSRAPSFFGDIMIYYGVCTVTLKVTLLGEFDDVEDATGAAYNAPGLFAVTPMTENDLLTLLLNAAKCLNL